MLTTNTMTTQTPVLPTVKKQFSDMVEKFHRMQRKTTIPEAYDLAAAEWRKTYQLEPPYGTFDSYRKSRERVHKR